MSEYIKKVIVPETPPAVIDNSNDGWGKRVPGETVKKDKYTVESTK